MNSLPQTGSVRRFSLPNDLGSDLSIDKTKWHGSFDDYLILRSQSPSQSQSDTRRRHSHSAFDFGQALLLEVNLDNSLRNYHSSLAPSGSTGHGSTGHEHHRAHHRAKRNNSQLPPPCPMNHPLGLSSDFRNEQSYSYSAFELGCALLLNMNPEASSTRRSASVTPKIQIFQESPLPNFKKNEQPLVNTITDYSSNTMFYKPHGYKSCDESGASNKRDNRKRSNNLTRNYFSVSDLTSPVIGEMNHDEGLTRKSASLTPDCIYGQTFGELDSLKFQSGPTSYHQKLRKNDRLKAKRGKRSKAKKHKKPLRKVNNVKPTSTSTNAASDASYESFDDSDAYESFDDSDAYESNTDNQNRYQMFSRNSQSANDFGTSILLETHHDDRSRNRSKSLTPNYSYYSDDSVQFVAKKREPKHHTEVEKDRKQLPPTYPTKEMDSSSMTRPDLCPSCLYKIDLRSLDGSIASEYDYECGIQKVKQQAEDDVRCMRLLQSELEAERNAATVAANHAMNMITRLQQEKASLQMEALQYLRMMEEQAEYDMEVLQKANELVEEKENEIQDLLNELEQYRNKYGDEPINNIKSFDEERNYILESLSRLDKKINQLVNRADEKSTESETFVDFGKLEDEILNLKMKMEALQADLDLVKHVCNTLHANEGLEFIQEIAHQLKDIRNIVSSKGVTVDSFDQVVFYLKRDGWVNSLNSFLFKDLDNNNYY
ncbi:uncharacterized protein LOC143623851 [Bidens hawaiensis]|uniref:uncharacterized protein LOC143623851 n=1 Tax=Bidens hawaiensis TaxID=980011 RepID=UPI00404A9497